MLVIFHIIDNCYIEKEKVVINKEGKKLFFFVFEQVKQWK